MIEATSEKKIESCVVLVSMSSAGSSYGANEQYMPSANNRGQCEHHVGSTCPWPCTCPCPCPCSMQHAACSMLHATCMLHATARAMCPSPCTCIRPLQTRGMCVSIMWAKRSGCEPGTITTTSHRAKATDRVLTREAGVRK
eukprot:2327671-Prymnesium_polylepis.1